VIEAGVAETGISSEVEIKVSSFEHDISARAQTR
jgi:hypothetical protein